MILNQFFQTLLENAMQLQKDLRDLLMEGGCNLRKWIPDSEELLKEIPEDYRDSPLTLGVTIFSHQNIDIVRICKVI